jgi:hypothetical protein
VTEKDILGALRDLDAIRVTKSFEDNNILLDIWENKFNKWLNQINNFTQEVSYNKYY